MPSGTSAGLPRDLVWICWEGSIGVWKETVKLDELVPVLGCRDTSGLKVAEAGDGLEQE